jgi:uncharacterized membrane protein
MRSKASIKNHPIHPILVGFPIAMWVGGFVFDLIGTRWPNPGLWAAGFYCVIAGCVCAVLAAVPGLLDLLYAVPPESSAKQRGLIHGGLNSLNLLLFVYVAYRLGSPSRAPDSMTLVLMAIGVVILGVAGWMGGWDAGLPEPDWRGAQLCQCRHPQDPINLWLEQAGLQPKRAWGRPDAAAERRQ